MLTPIDEACVLILICCYVDHELVYAKNAWGLSYPTTQPLDTVGPTPAYLTQAFSEVRNVHRRKKREKG